jgi:hypothetical protein
VDWLSLENEGLRDSLLVIPTRRSVQRESVVSIEFHGNADEGYATFNDRSILALGGQKHPTRGMFPELKRIFS